MIITDAMIQAMIADGPAIVTAVESAEQPAGSDDRALGCPQEPDEGDAAVHPLELECKLRIVMWWWCGLGHFNPNRSQSRQQLDSGLYG